MMPLKAPLIRPDDAIRDPNLPHVMRFGRAQLLADDIVDLGRKHFARCVAGQAYWWRGLEGE